MPKMPPVSSQTATPRQAGLHEAFQEDVTTGLINGALRYLGWMEDTVLWATLRREQRRGPESPGQVERIQHSHGLQKEETPRCTFCSPVRIGHLDVEWPSRDRGRNPQRRTLALEYERVHPTPAAQFGCIRSSYGIIITVVIVTTNLAERGHKTLSYVSHVRNKDSPTKRILMEAPALLSLGAHLRQDLWGPPGKQATSRGVPGEPLEGPWAGPPATTIYAARPTMVSVMVTGKGFFKAGFLRSSLAGGSSTSGGPSPSPS